jgi:hypothetical protein
MMALTAAPAVADSAKPGASMTHLKTVAGLASTLEAAGILLYSQGGATSSVIGDSLGAANSHVVFHVPVTGTKAGVQHAGSMLVFFNTANNQQVQLRNPVIDLGKGLVSATVPQGTSSAPVPVLTIVNASSLKPTVKTDRAAGLRTTVYSGAQLAIAPGAGPILDALLGLPSGTLVDGAPFATADVTLNAATSRR